MNKEQQNKNKFVRSNHYFQKWQIEWMENNRLKTGITAAQLLRQLLNEYIQRSKN